MSNLAEDSPVDPATRGSETDASPLFKPFVHGALRLPNRVVMAPMGRAFSRDGVPEAGYGGYFRRRVEGGVGLVMGEGAAIGDPSAGWDDTTPNFFGETALAAWADMLGEVKAAGGAMVPQLWHTGMQREKSLRDPDLEPIGPSGLWTPPASAGGEPEPLGQPMSQSRIDEVVAAYGEAAAAAARLGFDGVEVHMAHGYLIDQFFWPRTNRRTDGYGGGPAERSRFAVEVIQEVRRRVGPAFPLFVRISQFKMGDYRAKLAADPQELEVFLAPLVDAGVDIFDCSQRRFWEAEFLGSPLNLAGWVKTLTGRPVVTVGSIGLERDFTMETLADHSNVSLTRLRRLEQMLADEEVDLVALGRSLLSDPQWPVKIRLGKGHLIRPYSGEFLAQLS